MIPPLAPGQTDDRQQNMVGWKNTFNMRHVTLMNLAASQIGLRNGNISDIPSFRLSHCMTGPAKSLDLLRKNLQSAVNKDIENVINKYLEKFFQPAVVNIKNNLGKDSVTQEHLNDVCRQMLEEAKNMYKVSRDSSPYDCSDSEGGSLFDSQTGRLIVSHRKRKESDTDSETTTAHQQKRHKQRSTALVDHLHKLPLRREGPKWDPDRITHKSLFIMGAKANKVLGFGQTRGRLYVRHPDLVRYSGDQEDKEWLAAKNLMPPSGGKAYLMLLDDIKELTLSDDYRNNPHLQLNELKGFEVPQFLLHKIKTFIETVRTDKRTTLDPFEYHRHNLSSPNTLVDSAPSTPSDTLQMLESQSVSSKHSETNFIHAPEISPGSNNSFMSGQLTQSPVPVSGGLLSPSVLMGVASTEAGSGNGLVVLQEHVRNHNSLGSLLGSDNSQDF